MRQHDIVGIEGVDTRALTKILRSQGSSTFHRRKAEDKDGPADAIVAQLKRFIQVGNSKPVHALCLIYFGKFYCTVAVAIRLNHRHNLHLRPGNAPDFLQVVTNRIQINFSPGTF